jgi:two-component system sensor histidine kinase CpxA
MRPAGNIFVKIFLGFWLVSVCVLGSWLVADHYFQSRPVAGEPGDRPPGTPHRFLLRVIYELQNTPSGELPDLLAATEKRYRIKLFLLDAAGQDILGRPVPAAATGLAEQLRGPRRRAYGRTPDSRLLAHDIYRVEEGPLRAVLVLPATRHDILRLLSDNLWLRLGLAVIVSGLLCFGLSRLMTGRLKELQTASRRLASGELDTRLQVRELGGDETDELARDFNTMAQQLQERIQAQKRLLHDVSHELRSPLARLRVALALAERGGPDTAQYLQRIDQETERLEALIAQLLSTREQPPTLEDHVDLAALLEKLCADARFEGRPLDKDVVFACDRPQAIVATAGDLLQKIFENILRNAVHHTPPHSTVSVSLTGVPEGYSVRITDQGAGVEEGELNRIFDEFYRADTARSRETGGHGLGLAIARRAVVALGGRVEAANTGRGLAVTVFLPGAGIGDTDSLSGED